MTAVTLPAALASAPKTLEVHAHALLERAARKRDAARAAAVAALATPRYARLALRLQAWTLSPPPKGPTLSRLAPRRLDRAHQRLFSAARFFAALSPERRHRVRILAKRLRYSLDVMSVALPKQTTERYVAALSELQDVLGALNDISVARSALGSVTDKRAVYDRVVAPLADRERHLVLAAEAHLLLLHEATTLW
jgi:CHAD domain-containing protein